MYVELKRTHIIKLIIQGASVCVYVCVGVSTIHNY